MRKTKTAGALKSLSYVAMLTFFVPAGGFYLSNGLFSETAEAGQTVSHYFYPEVSTGSRVAACPDLDGDEII